MHSDGGTEAMALRVLAATTGEDLLTFYEVASDMRVWQVKLALGERYGSSPFEWRLLAGNKLIADHLLVRSGDDNVAITFSALRQRIQPLLPYEWDELTRHLLDGNAGQVWELLAKGRTVGSSVSIRGVFRNPLNLALQGRARLCRQERANLTAPGSLFSLLKANCDPNVQNGPELLPLDEASAYRDDEAIYTLVTHGAQGESGRRLQGGGFD